MISKEKIDQISKDILEKSSVTFENGSTVFGLLAYKILSDRQKAIKPVDENESKDKIGYYIEPNYLFEKVAQRARTNSEKWYEAFQKFAVTNPLLSDMFTSEYTRLGEIKDKSLEDYLTTCDFTRFSVTESSLLIDELLENCFSDHKMMYLWDAPKQMRELIADILNSEVKTGKVSIFDPVAMSGSLLLTMKEKFQSIVELYGEEFSPDIFRLSKMNMLIHGMDTRTIHSNFVEGDFLTNKHFEGNSKFDIIPMTPPFSRYWDANPELLNDPCFSEVGVLPPKSKADYAYVLRGLQHLSEDGTMAVMLPTGALFRSAAEGEIRKYLLEKQKIHAVIALPQGARNFTGIYTVLLVFKQKKSDKVLFIDASRDGVKNATRLKQNFLTEAGFNKILHTYRNREEVDRYSRLVSLDEIRENDYNLNIPRYIDTFSEKKIDVEATMSSLSAKQKVIETSKKEMIEFLRNLDTPEARQAIKAVSISE
ncbi:N-6 DNA methylase [Lactobacillus delbrueckii]|uniref:site-specific DNA-methyltransferase (adenine-specific) n=1 Tax=Lactobacillus delbrueckii subsp. lactis TaxID=29397 RepID=A0ABD4SIC6_LACDL|nr:N-6 DNA methylase [Lactobacillus delbrueckii]MCD5561985.1 SAM-dependent methyltransferase [Lactobacillus delbrueckii subsp. lactis]MCD5563520.1 SAM-dependent methyltransferase [Lactobacillus delbrueckii subsp. lactis]